jgi:RNA polymerase sigma-70 factor, ECF subfamily
MELNFLRTSSSHYDEAQVSDTTQQLYEQMLVLRSQIGDETAFEELVALHGPHLLLFTQKMLASAPEQVEDVTQEIWLSIFRGLPRLREAGKFRPWAFRIARDRIYREYRRRKWAAQAADDNLPEILPESEEPAFGLDADDVQNGLALIPPEQREALVLRFFEEMSYEDIACVTECSVGTVRSRIHYGKRALKSALERKKHELGT